jgi:hypothetical protein
MQCYCKKPGLGGIREKNLQNLGSIQLEAGPRGFVLISVLWKGSELIDIWLAKKFSFHSGPVGIRSDITSKSGFFASLRLYREAKKVSAR